MVSQDDKIINNLIKKEKNRKMKSSGGAKEFVVKSIQGEAGRLGSRDRPIYVNMEGATRNDEGSLVSGGEYMFFINKVSSKGGFTELFLFATNAYDYVARAKFPKKLIEIC